MFPKHNLSLKQVPELGVIYESLILAMQVFKRAEFKVDCTRLKASLIHKTVFINCTGSEVNKSFRWDD